MQSRPWAPSREPKCARPPRALLEQAADELGQLRISGSISEVTPAYVRVVGLSRFLKLGECVSSTAAGRSQLAEVVRIDEEGVTVKTFDTAAFARLGERVYRANALTIFPDQGWKGRVVNALGIPIDAGGQLPLGNKAAAIDVPPPAAMRRARIETPL
jgi:flagellum-specific ATP synthase